VDTGLSYLDHNVSMWKASLLELDDLDYVDTFSKPCLQELHQTLKADFECTDDNNGNVRCVLSWTKSVPDFRPIGVARHGDEETGRPIPPGKSQTVCSVFRHPFPRT
jgi:hypothetical protein